MEKGYLNLDIPESKIELDIDGKVTNNELMTHFGLNYLNTNYRYGKTETDGTRLYWKLTNDEQVDGLEYNTNYYLQANEKTGGSFLKPVYEWVTKGTYEFKVYRDITVTSSENGTVTVDGAFVQNGDVYSVYDGETITLNITPADGYKAKIGGKDVGTTYTHTASSADAGGVTTLNVQFVS